MTRFFGGFLPFAVAFLLVGTGPNSDPTEAARLNNLGVAYMNQQLFEKALHMFEAAAAKDPNLKVATLNCGVAFLNLQKIDQAKAVLEKAANDDPKDPHVWFNLGLYYKNSSSSEGALDAFRRVTEIDPNDADTWYFLGATYLQLYSAAKHELIPQASIEAPHGSTLNRSAGQEPNAPHEAEARYLRPALAAFEQALKLNPLHASAQFGVARTYQQSGQIDSAHEAMKKFQYVTQNKLGTPISLSYGEQGKYSRAEESPLVPQKVPPQIEVKFVDVTKAFGFESKPSTTRYKSEAEALPAFGPGACFLDYDNDGKIDVLLADDGPEGGLVLFHNLGTRFEDVTKTAGLDPTLHALGCTAGDYDNDGFTDLVLTSADGVFLFHNEKNGTFKEVTEAAGIRNERFTLGATFVDYDHDGDLDLYVARSGMAPGEVCGVGRFSGPAGTNPNPGPGTCVPTLVGQKDNSESVNSMWRNNANGTFTDVTDVTGLGNRGGGIGAVGDDYNNDRAVDLIVDSWQNPDGNDSPNIFENRREGAFLRRRPWPQEMSEAAASMGVTVLDFNHDGWMDLAFTHYGSPGISLWQNMQSKTFERVSLRPPLPNESELPAVVWSRAYGIVAFDYDNDGWIDLAAVGETKDGKGEVRLFRNLGPAGWKDVTTDVGLDKIQLREPRAIIAGDYDNDGAVDLLITQNHGPAVLLRNEGGNKNNSLRLALKGLNDNKSAIGTKVEVFSDGIRQKFEVYGSSGYLGQNSPYLTIGLGQAKQADVVRMLWPTGVLQDEIEVPANKVQTITELDRRGSSCPTLFAWDGTRYTLVGDMLGAGVIGHWMAPGKPGANNGAVERNVPRPTEAIKLDRSALREKDGELSFRFTEPLEESVYLDEAKLLAVDHPADLDVYPNEYFASNPPFPRFKVVFSSTRDTRPPGGARDEYDHDVLPDLLAHRYLGDFKVLPFLGFAEPHSLELDLGEPYRGGPLWLLMHGEVEYFSANSMYAADQAGVRPFAPYVETQNEKGQWIRVIDDLGFPAGDARTMTADLTGKLPTGARRIRLTTNLQIYWDNILISRTDQHQTARLTPVPLVRANLSFHGFPLKIEDQPPGNVKYIYEQTSATGPYTRPAGAYTRYGDVLALLTSSDDKFAVFGSGDEIALDFDPATLPKLPVGWVRDYFFIANGYEKDMDFYAYRGNEVGPLPFSEMKSYPYPGQSFPADADHLIYQLEYNTRFMFANEATGYSFQYKRTH